MRRVLLDTVGLIAIWDVSDQWHADASRVFHDLVAQNATLLTTTLILAEAGNASARKTYRNDVDDLRISLEQLRQLIVPTDDDWMQGWIQYRNDVMSRAGIVDHISFVIMNRMEMTEVFSNDKHFRAAGFTTLF